MDPQRPSRTGQGKALREALEKLLSDVAAALDAFPGDPARSAHFLRTRIKRLQSLCRLAPRGKSWRAKFLPPCRELKDLFAETRDVTIVQALAETYAPGEACHLRAAAPPDLVRARELAQAATGLLDDFAGWEEIAWQEIADLAVGTYRAARKSWKLARRRNAPDEAFHEWRRRVKRLLYQCEYLGGRARLVRFTRRVDRLGEILGEIQDVCMAEDWLTRQRGLAVPPDLPRSKGVFRREALRRAPVLLDAKPKVFRKMLG